MQTLKHLANAVMLAGALLVQPAGETAFCDWLDMADTHWDVLTSFMPEVAYDILAYPEPLAKAVSARLVAAGCDY